MAKAAAGGPSPSRCRAMPKTGSAPRATITDWPTRSTGAPGRVPGERHGVAGVQRVSGEGRVPSDRDEGKYRRVECDADGDDPPRVELGHPDRGNQKPERDGSEQHTEAVLGPRAERGRPAQPEEKGARQPDASAHRRQ